MDENNALIFRYDNTKHHPHIETFPHHKHTPKEISNCSEPDMLTVLKEIKDYLEAK